MVAAAAQDKKPGVFKTTYTTQMNQHHSKTNLANAENDIKNYEKAHENLKR